MNRRIRLIYFLFLMTAASRIFAQPLIINKEQIKIVSKIDSLQQALKKTNADTIRVNLLNALGREVLSKSEYQKANDYFQQAKILAEKLGDKKGTITAYNNIGDVCWFQGEYEKTLQNWLISLKLSEETGNQEGIATANSNIGMVYAHQGNYKKAQDSYVSALNIGKAIGDKKTMIYAYNKIGSTYQEQGFLSKDNEVKRSMYLAALDSLTKGLHLTQEGGYRSEEAVAYINIGNVYYCLGNIAPTKEEASRWYEKDLDFQNNALKIKEAMDDQQGIALCYSSMGIVYYMSENSERSAYYIEKALSLYKKIGYKAGIKESYSYLCQLSEEKGDYKKALEYHKLFTGIKDSLFSEESNKRMVEMAEKYQSEKKQRENEILGQKNQLLNEQSKIQDLKITESRYFILGLLLLSVFIIGIAFLLIRQNRANALYAKIEMEQKLLRSQMNPHFIFNAMVGIQNYIYKEEPEVAANYLSSVVQLMRSIIDNSKKESVLLEKEISTLHHYLTLQKVRFGEKFNFSIAVAPEIEPDNMFIPPMMAQPFIENAIVHGIMHKTDGQGMILVKFKLQDQYLVLEIEDNGVGREKAKEAIQADQPHLSIATNITQERLAILNRSSKLKSSVTILDLKNGSGEPEGTRVIFLFPLLKI